MASGKGYRSHSEGRTEENCSFDLGNASALSESVGSLVLSYSGYTREGDPWVAAAFSTMDLPLIPPSVCLLWLAAFLEPAVIVTSIRWCSSREDLLHRRKSLSPSPSFSDVKNDS